MTKTWSFRCEFIITKGDQLNANLEAYLFVFFSNNRCGYFFTKHIRINGYLWMVIRANRVNAIFFLWESIELIFFLVRLNRITSIATFSVFFLPQNNVFCWCQVFLHLQFIKGRRHYKQKCGPWLWTASVNVPILTVFLRPPTL